MQHPPSEPPPGPADRAQAVLDALCVGEELVDAWYRGVGTGVDALTTLLPELVQTDLQIMPDSLLYSQPLQVWVKGLPACMYACMAKPARLCCYARLWVACVHALSKPLSSAACNARALAHALHPATSNNNTSIPASSYVLESA